MPDIRVVRERDLQQFSTAEMDLNKLLIKADHTDLALTEGQKYFNGTQLKNAIKGYRTQFILSASQRANLEATKVKILSKTTDTDEAIVIDNIYMYNQNVTTPWTNASSPIHDVRIGYWDGLIFHPLDICIPEDAMYGSVDTIFKAERDLNFAPVLKIGRIVPNCDIYILVDSGDSEWVGGDGVLVLLIDYHIENLNDFAAP